MTLSKLEPLQPDSIKDNIVSVVHRHGDTSRAIISRYVCCNDSIFAVALDALVRDGYLSMIDRDTYRVHESLHASYAFDKSTAAAPVMTHAKPLPTETMMPTQTCTGPCGLPKPLSEFYANNKQCKRCVLDRQKNARDVRAGKAPTPAKPSAKKPTPATSLVPSELSISHDDRQVGGSHYINMDVQPWAAFQSWMTHEQFIGYLRGNVINYLARCDAKGGIADLQKARHYLDKLIAVMAAQA